MDQDAAQIEIAAAAHQRQRDAAVHGEGGDRGPDHPALDDVNGRAQALDGFVAEPQGKDNQQEGVGEGGENAGAMVAVGFFGVGGAFSPAHRQPGDAQGGNVGEIVHGIVEQSDGVAENAADYFRGDEPEGGDHGPAKNRGSQRGMHVAVVDDGPRGHGDRGRDRDYGRDDVRLCGGDGLRRACSCG